MLITVDHSPTRIFSFELTNQYDSTEAEVVAHAERLAEDRAKIDGWCVSYIVLAEEMCGEAAHHYTFEVYGVFK